MKELKIIIGLILIIILLLGGIVGMTKMNTNLVLENKELVKEVKSCQAHWNKTLDDCSMYLTKLKSLEIKYLS